MPVIFERSVAYYVITCYHIDMKRIILIISVVAALFAGGFVFFTIDKASEPTTPESYRFSLDPERLRRDLVGVTITIPNGDDAPTKIVLDQYPIDGEVLLGGSFVGTDKGVPVNVNVVIPDFDIIDAERASVLGVSGADGIFFLAPMYVNFGGTGTFLMIGLYEFDDSSGKIIHHAVHFIDDRVPFDGFTRTTDGLSGSVLVHYKTRAEGEAMATSPTLTAVRSIARDGVNINLIE